MTPKKTIKQTSAWEQAYGESAYLFLLLYFCDY